MTLQSVRKEKSNYLFKRTIGKIMQYLDIAQNPELKKSIKIELWKLSDDLKSQGLLINNDNFDDTTKLN